ncbi:hypothetical protein E4U41_004537, partial [Claviceps citrina]
ILPVILAAIECPTHSIVDSALRTLPSVLPVLDFSTIKNELFPIVATVFSRTNSLAIKVRGLQAFVMLCGGSVDGAGAGAGATDDGGLNGLVENKKKTSSSSALDKYTMQDKIVPLVRAIKTKEPAVMVAALHVLRIVGEVADADFVAMDILPILWNMSLGPLLNLRQFQSFMELIKKLSRRVEDEQTKKLQELAGTANAGTAGPNEDFLAFGGVTGTAFDSSSHGHGGNEDDFEALVKGKGKGAPGSASSNTGNNDGFPSWNEASSAASAARSTSSTPKTPSFSWSTQAATGTSTPRATAAAAASPQSALSRQASFRTVTPDLGRFGALAPSSTQYSQPLQPTPANPWASSSASSSASSANYTNYPSSHAPTASGAGLGTMNNSPLSSMSLGQQPSSRNSSFFIPPPPPPPPPPPATGITSSPSTSFSLNPPSMPPSQTQTSWLG